ncbi:MAG: class I SAM-dependent methyltransferase [Ruthenibacterium sp.]
MPANKQLPALDARLAAAAALVRRGCVCADIGCDHGKLSVHLAASGLCSRVIACDASEMPLSHARAALEAFGCANAECRLGDGLSVLQPDEVDDIVIAGLSGVTLVQILAAAPAFWRQRYRFIFVPASKPEILRRWLCEHGFARLAEMPVQAAGRVYSVLHACYTGKKISPAPLFCAVGLVKDSISREECGCAACAYLKKTAGQLRKQGEEALAKEVEACLPVKR